MNKMESNLKDENANVNNNSITKMDKSKVAVVGQSSNLLDEEPIEQKDVSAGDTADDCQIRAAEDGSKVTDDETEKKEDNDDGAKSNIPDEEEESKIPEIKMKLDAEAIDLIKDEESMEPTVIDDNMLIDENKNKKEVSDLKSDNVQESVETEGTPEKMTEEMKEDEIQPVMDEILSIIVDGIRLEAEKESPDGKGDTRSSNVANNEKNGISKEEGMGDSEILLPKIDQHKARRHRDCILEPLSFPDTSEEIEQGLTEDAASSLNQQTKADESFEFNYAKNQTPCMLCENLYEDVETKEQHDEYLCHLIVEHKMVVADVKLIANLRSYAIYWKKRFSEKSIKEFCALIKTNTSPKDMHESEEYFLLCDALPEDRKIREKLQLEKLKELIVQQSEERNDENFERMCLFCTKFFIGNRSELFNHMNEDHNFNVGHPHNLIHIEEFLNEIEKKLSNLECLFCEKLFRDRGSLRDHMRKKSHRRLNPKNKLYDKYYIINYLEFGKNWEILQGEPEQLDPTEDWSGWDEESQSAVCFFCSASFSARDYVYGHMRDVHDFDFPKMRKDMNLSFYQQVKMINYIRREVHQKQESEKLDDDEMKGEPKVIDDVTRANTLAQSINECILTSTKWNQPQYYFPTYENDTLLCQLEDKEGLFEPEDTFIIGEDGIDCKAIINESVLTDLVVQGYFD